MYESSLISAHHHLNNPSAKLNKFVVTAKIFMSEISDMIQRLCPDGVEYRKLVSVAKVQYGYPFDSKLFTDNPSFIPLIRIRDVKSGLAGTYYSGPILSDYIVCAGDILVGMDGEFNLGKWKDRDSLLNQRVCKITSLDSNIVLDGFLYHLLLLYKHQLLV